MTRKGMWSISSSCLRRAAAFSGVAVQRELRDHEHAAPLLREIAIHLAFVVPEQAQAEDLVGHPVQDCIRISGREPGEREESAPDLSDGLALHAHRGAR